MNKALDWISILTKKENGVERNTDFWWITVKKVGYKEAEVALLQG